MKWIRRFFLFSIVIVLLLLAAISVALLKYEDEIKQFVVSSLNQGLRTEIKVEAVDLSLWNSFPKVSVLFNEVVIHAVDAKSDTLISAKTLGAQFDLYDLYQGNYRLNGLQIDNGFCRLVVDQSGRENYIFWEADSSQDSNFNLDLEAVQLNEVDFSYVNYSKDFELIFEIDQAKLKGNFSKAIFDLNLNASIANSTIRNGEVYFIQNRKIALNTKGKVDSQKELISFERSSLSIDEVNFETEGAVNYSDKSSLDLILESSNTKLENAISLLPKQIRKSLQVYDITGSAKITAQVQGPISAIDQPSYQADFSVTNGTFTHQESGFSFQKTNLQGNINNGAENRLSTTSLTLNSLKTETKNGKISGKGMLKNFSQPNFTFEGNAVFSLADILEMTHAKGFESNKGEVQAQLKIDGKLADLSHFTLNDWKRSKIEGNIKLIEVQLKSESLKESFSQVNGEIEVKNNTLQIQDLSLLHGENDAILNGSVNNLVGYLVENQELLLDLKLSSNYLNLEPYFENTSDSKESEERGTVSLYLYPSVKELSYQEYHLKNFSSDLLWKNSNLDLRNCRFNFLEGEIETDFFWRSKTSGTHITYANANLKNIDFAKLFKTFNNFGQKTIESQHLKGFASCMLDFSANWDQDWKVDPSSIQIESDLIIENGELLNFKPIEKLASYIELEELQHIKFKTLQNHILVKNKTIYIPRFQVNNSALNLTLEGSHTFDNQIDYQFELVLNELLGRKVKKPKENEFGYVEDDGLGRTKIFLKMTGNVDNPEVSYDKEQLKSHVKEKVNEEKQTIKRLLNEEFGLFKNDSISKPKKKETEEKPFTIEWDDSENQDTSQTKSEKKEESQSEKKKTKKGKFGKFIDKIAQPNEEEYVEPKEN